MGGSHECAVCIKAIKDCHKCHAGLYSQVRLLLVIWPKPLRAPTKEMIYVFI